MLTFRLLTDCELSVAVYVILDLLNRMIAVIDQSVVRCNPTTSLGALRSLLTLGVDSNSHVVQVRLECFADQSWPVNTLAIGHYTYEN